MFRLFKILLITAIIITKITISCEAAKKVVAVMPIENISGYTEQQVADIMTEQITVAIQNSGNYTVVERAQMGTVLREIGFQNIMNPEAAIETGKLTGAQYTLIGKVTMATVTKDKSKNIVNDLANRISKRLAGIEVMSEVLQGKVALDFRFVDNQTGEIIFARMVEGNANGNNADVAIHSACKIAAENVLAEIRNKNPLVARVADIYDKNIYIDQGIDSGLNVGESLIISREAGPIMVNDKIVGMKQIYVGKATIIEVNYDYSICKIVDSLYEIKKGDIVKRGQ